MPGKKELLSKAKAELGYLEKSKANYSLYGAACLIPKTQYAGADNYTKYAYDLNNAGLGHKNGQAWCLTFICWLYWVTFGATYANKLLCGMLSSASTMDTKDAMIAKGRQVPLNKAEPGDIVFRSRSGGGHVGLVVGRSGSGQIITIEGNSSSDDITSWNGGAVVQHTGAPWEWCVRPDYALVPNAETWDWLESGGSWYYQNQNGENWHGWHTIKERYGNNWHKYYFANDGKMLTGAHWINEKLCLFMPLGPLQGAMCVTDAEGYQNVWNVPEPK